MLLLCMFFCFICISLFVSFIWFTFTVEWIPYKIFLYRGIITIKKSWVKPVQPPCWHPASSTPLPLSCQFWLQEYLVQLLVLIATQYFLASLLCGSQTEVWFVMKLHSLKSISYTHPENKNSYISMLFVVFSSAFNTISPMKPIGKLNTGLEHNTLHLDIGLPHKQTSESSDWQSQLLNVSAQIRSPPGLCAQPSPVHIVH